MDQHERIAAVRTRLRELQTEEYRAEAAGPPCSKCIHIRPAHPAPLCGHIAQSQRVYNASRGEWIERGAVPVNVARNEEGLCGPEAILFERKSIFPSFLRRIMGD